MQERLDELIRFCSNADDLSKTRSLVFDQIDLVERIFASSGGVFIVSGHGKSNLPS
jgi:hypothetical protein